MVFMLQEQPFAMVLLMSLILFIVCFPQILIRKKMRLEMKIRRLTPRHKILPLNKEHHSMFFVYILSHH